MKMGTKSLLFGVHQLAIHPLFVALAWWKLYGFPWDLRLWFAFFLHDIGYWGLKDLDGEAGDCHPYRGAYIMLKLFGEKWWRFCFFHSRHTARACGEPISRLCVADKLSIILMPNWLYLILSLVTGELKEYMTRSTAKEEKIMPTEGDEIGLYSTAPIKWRKALVIHIQRWVDNNKHIGDQKV